MIISVLLLIALSLGSLRKAWVNILYVGVVLVLVFATQLGFFVAVETASSWGYCYSKIAGPIYPMHSPEPRLAPPPNRCDVDGCGRGN